MTERYTRRELLGSGASVAGFGLAGCSSDSDVTTSRAETDGEQTTLSASDVPTERFDPADGLSALQALLDEYGASPVAVRVGAGKLLAGTNLLVPSNTLLRGVGQDTVFRFSDGANLTRAGLIRLKGAENVTISDLRVDGNRANVTDDGDEYGVFTSAARNVRFERVVVHDCPGYGFDPHASDEGPTAEIAIVDCEAFGNGLDGFTLAGIQQGYLVRCHAHDNVRHGVNVTDEEVRGVVVRETRSLDNGGSGVAVQNSAVGTVIQSNELHRNAEQGVRVGTTTDAARDCSIVANAISANGASGVRVMTAERVVVAGNALANNATDEESAPAVVLATTTGGGARHCMVVGNLIDPGRRVAVEDRTDSNLVAANAGSEAVGGFGQ